MRLDLLTNATVVDDAIRFVSSNKFKDNLKSSSDNDEIGKEKSEELDYDEDKVQLEEEQEVEMIITRNKSSRESKQKTGYYDNNNSKHV